MAPITHRVEVNDASHVGEARRLAAKFGRNLGFGDERLARAGLVVTEAATNLIKHTPHGGELLLQTVERAGIKGLEMFALDRGPGMANSAVALGDGYSTAGSSGTGLGAMRRQADFFDLFSQPGRGTAIVARVWSTRLPEGSSGERLEVGAVRVPRPGEVDCGDDWAVAYQSGRNLLMVVDGLGHGSSAMAAATEAVTTFHRNLRYSPAELMRAIDSALRHTRGGVGAVAEIAATRDRLTFVGTGNISGTLRTQGNQRSMVSHPGTLGQELRKVQSFEYAWSPGAMLVLFSDGLNSRIELRNHPGLESKSAALISGFLYQQYRRGRDDATIVVAREA